MSDKARCSQCLYCNSYQDGEAEPQFGEMVLISLEWVDECKKKSSRFNPKGETDCKSFKKRM